MMMMTTMVKMMPSSKVPNSNAKSSFDCSLTSMSTMASVIFGRHDEYLAQGIICIINCGVVVLLTQNRNQNQKPGNKLVYMHVINLKSTTKRTPQPNNPNEIQMDRQTVSRLKNHEKFLFLEIGKNWKYIINIMLILFRNSMACVARCVSLTLSNELFSMFAAF